MMQIHPAVIMSISEHHTRTKAIRQQPEVVIGALLGKKTDHNVEVVDSFELRHKKDPSVFEDNFKGLLLDKEFYQRKIPLVKQVFIDLDLIGWYSTSLCAGELSVDQSDLAFHRQIQELIPNPIFLKLDPYKRESDPKINGSLPMKVYEPVIEVDSGENINPIEVGWTIVTEEVEIIGLEHNAKMTEQNVVPSAAIDNLRLQFSAVKQLKDRIKVVSKYVKDVQAGTLPYQEETVTKIAQLIERFPLMSSSEYTKSYNIQCNDVALNTYLGILTKGSMTQMQFGAARSKTRAFPSTHALSTGKQR